MASGRQNKLAGQVAEHLVCAELGRRGLIATPFAGNVPTFDVLATDLECRTVPLQVKATRGDKWPSDARLWLDLAYDERRGIQHNRGPLPLANPNLIYVCVALHGPDDGGRDRYFVLTKTDVQNACIQSYTAYMAPKGWRRPKNPESYDCRFHVSHLIAFENNWQLIEDRLSCAAT